MSRLVKDEVRIYVWNNIHDRCFLMYLIADLRRVTLSENLPSPLLQLEQSRPLTLPVR